MHDSFSLALITIPDFDFTCFFTGSVGKEERILVSILNKNFFELIADLFTFGAWNLVFQIHTSALIILKALPVIVTYLARIGYASTSGLTHTTKVSYQSIGSGVNWGTSDHMLNIQELLLLISVKFSSPLYVLVAITSWGIESWILESLCKISQLLSVRSNFLNWK